MRLKYLVLAAALFAVSELSSAQEAAGPNGGQLTEVKGHTVEFTIKDKEIVLFLSDSKGLPITTQGTTGRVVVLDGDKKTSAELTASEPNILSAKLEAQPAAGAKVVVSVRHSDGHELQARFVTK